MRLIRASWVQAGRWMMFMSIVTGLSLLSGLTSTAAESSVVLAWDPSPDASVVGYKIHYGTASGNYTTVHQAGNATTTTIAGLQQGSVYYFVATAYAADGLESDFSNEVRYEVPGELINQPPTINTLPDLAVNENSASRTITLSGITAGALTESQVLVVTAASSNPSLVPDPVVNYQSPNTTGTLTFRPTANSRGSVVITVIVNDQQAQNSTSTRSFTVSVNPYNEAPTLGLIADVVVDEDSGSQTVSLSGISSGAASEPQKLVVTATSSNPGIVPHPVVNYSTPNSSGALVFTPVPDMYGNATITVVVNDGHSLNNTVSRTFNVTVNPVNDNPTFAALPNLVLEENAGRQSVRLSGVSAGPANENQTLTITATSSNPGLIVNPMVVYASPSAEGTLTFDLVPFASGSATLAVTVSDGQTKNPTLTRSFTVTVQPVNQAPTLDTLANLTLGNSAGQQQVALTGISSGATNESQLLNVTAVSSNPEVIPHPTVSYSSPAATGLLRFTPTGATGSATITVTVNDGDTANNLVSRTFVVTVNLANEPPTLAGLNNLTVQEDSGTQIVALSGISAGSPNESQALSITALSSNPDLVPHPTVKYSNPSTTGSIVFTPAPDAFGTATISVTVDDGHSIANTTTRTFAVTVTPVNDAPTLNAIPSVAVNENAGEQTVALSGIGTGSDLEYQALTITAGSSNPSVISTPRVNYTSPATTGSLTFKPAGGAGTATITVTVSDGQSTDHTTIRTFTVTVNPMNEPPTLAAIADLSVSEDASTQTIGLAGIGSGSPNENQTLVVSATSSNPEIVPHPTVKYANPSSTGTLVFTPVPDANGSATISVTVNDGHSIASTTTRTFLVTVSPVNDPPTLDTITPIVINENNGEKVVTLTGIGSGAVNENQGLTITAVSSNPALVSNPRVAYTSPSSTGTLTFSPAGGSGAATVTVTVSDGQTTSGTTTRTFTVSVNPMNEPPTLAALSDITVEEDSQGYSVGLAGISSGSANENQTLRVTATSSNPALLPNPVVEYQSPQTTGLLRLAPNADCFGNATVTVTVDDGHTLANTFTRSFTVTVTPVNDAPTLSAIADLTIDENGGERTLNIGGIGTGSSAESQTLTITAISSDPRIVTNPRVTYTNPSATASLAFSPGGTTGTARITVTLDDGEALNGEAVRTFLVTVTPKNEAPTLGAIASVTIDEDSGNKTIDISGIGSGSANEAQTLTVTAVSSNPALVPHPTVKYVSPATTGSLVCTPAPNASGSATISVTVDDGHTLNNKTTRIFTVTVTPVNDAPTLDTILPLVMNENDGDRTVTLTGIGTGAANEDQTLTLTATSSNPSLVPNPKVAYASPASTGTLTFTPGSSSGTALITVTVSDGQASQSTCSRTFLVTVNPMNEPPTLGAIANVSIQEDAGLQTVALTGIGSGHVNENQTLIVTAVSSNPELIANPVVTYSSPSASGSLSFTLVPDAFGTATITVTVDDGHTMANVTSRSFLVTVAEANDAPTLAPLSPVVLNENGGERIVALSGISSGSGKEAQALVVTAISSNPSIIPNPKVNYVSPGSEGTLTLAPTGVAGSATITVTVDDGQTANNLVARSFAVSVNAMNEPPTLAELPDVTISEDAAAYAVSLWGISSGSANETQTLTITATSSNRDLVSDPVVRYTSPLTTGSLIVTPVGNANGTAIITVTINDGHTLANTTTRSFKVTVTPVNDRPSFGLIPDITLAENSGIHTVIIEDISPGAPNESQPLSFSAASSNPTLIASPVISYAPGSNVGSLSFTPVSNESGTAVITVTANDGQITDSTFTRSFRVTVTDRNEPPTLNPVSDLTIAENSGATTVKLTGISGGSAGEEETLTVTAESSNPSVVPAPVVTYVSPSSSGTLAVRPAQDASGTARITVTVHDGELVSSRSFLVTVTSVNQRPTLDVIMDLVVDENSGPQTVALSGISSGSANESQQLAVIAQSSNPALVADPVVSYTSPSSTGTLVFTTVKDTYGEATITVIVDDMQTSDNLVSRSFKVTVTPGNRPPTLDPLANISMVENAGPQIVALTGITSGMSNEVQSLTVTATSSDPNLIPNPTVYYTSPDENGFLTCAPVPFASGTATITVRAMDDQPANNVTMRTFVVTVHPINQAPTLNPLSPLSIAENAPLQTVNLGGITAGAANEKEQVYVTAHSSNPGLIPHPTVNFAWPSTTASLEFTPVKDAFGSATVTVSVNDGQTTNNITTRSFAVSVEPVNQAPTLDPLGLVSLPINPAKQTITLAGITSGAANERDVLTVSAKSSNTGLIPTPTVVYRSPETSGSLEFSVVSNMVGLAQITVTVNDGQSTNNTLSRTFLVNIGGQTLSETPNRPPTLNPLTNMSILENSGKQTVALSGITSGALDEVQQLRVTATSSNPNLIPHLAVSYASPQQTGTLEFASATNGYGSATITVEVSDGQATNSTVRRSFTVNVAAVNNPPTVDDLADMKLPAVSQTRQVTLSGLSSGAYNEFQALRITARSSNPSVMPDPLVTYKSGNSLGTLTLTSLGTAGNARITVTVDDGQAINNLTSKSFLVTVGTSSGDRASLEVKVKPNTGAYLLIKGSPGATYVIEYSPDPYAETWQTLQTVTLSGSTLELPMPDVGSSAFFRLRAVE